MPSPILTDGATFTCKHGGVGSLASGLSISNLASNVTINGRRPILAGATISGLFAGCQWPTLSSGGPPCSSFTLQAPSEGAITISGQAVYTAADAPTIALAQDKSNGQAGLQVAEPQTLVSA